MLNRSHPKPAPKSSWPSDYPGGYQVQSQGAVVVSAPNASMLQLATIPGQANVQVTVARR